MEVAVRGGRLDLVREVIRNGGDVNQRCRVRLGESSLLILAIDEGHKDVALALLAEGADVHAKDSTGWSPLHWACKMGWTEVAQALIDKGSQVNDGSGQSHTPLILAIQQGHEATSMCLLQAGASCAGLSEGQMHGLFRHACHVRDLLAVQALLKNGCNARKLTQDFFYLVQNLPKQEAEELFRFAYHECDMFVAHTLLKNGCSVSILSREEQEQLLHLACRECDMFVARTLVSNGCSVSILSAEEQEQLHLHCSCYRRDVFAVRTLIKNGCSVRKLTQEDILFLVHVLPQQEKEVLLRHACYQCGVFVAHTLLKNGCNVSILSTEEQEQLFHYACREDVFVARTLLTNGCSISILSREEQEQLLHLACHKSDVFLIRILIKNGCSVNILSREEQEQLLRLACHEKDVFVARTVLKNDCSIRIHRMEHELLLHLAYHESDVFLTHTLLKNGCDVTILSQEEQEQLLQLACHEKDVFVAHSLLKNDCSVSILSSKEKEQLLYLACYEDDVFVARTLLKNGCSVRILSRDKIEQLLHLACHENDVFVARTLLKNGCSVSILSREEQEQLLHLACDESDVFLAHILIKNGCSVRSLSTDKQEKLLHLACHENDVFVVRDLFKNGCNVTKLSLEDLTFVVLNLSVQEKEELLHRVCCVGSVFVVHTLLKNGCSVSILSRGEQEELFHDACHEDDVFVVHTLLKNGCSISILSREEHDELFHNACREDVFVVHMLLKDDCSVSILSRKEQEQLLHLAYHESDVFVIRTLLKNGCSVSFLSSEEQEELLQYVCRDGDVFVVEAVLANNDCNINCVVNGYTPLMVATEKGHEEVVKKLILAGANLGKQSASGDTALHLAASANNILCGVLLAEGGASVRTRNNSSQTPLDLAKAEFKEAIKQALNFATRKALCIIGNAEGGKSTLIAALQAERSSRLHKMVNRFRRVSDCRQRTTGIEIIPHSSKRYGEVLFFDFAGQHEYHGPHQMFLESLLSKPGVSMTLLLVVKSTEEEEAIQHQLHRWLSPVGLMATPESPPQVIIIGSFLDKVKRKKEAIAKLTRCIETIKKDLEELPLEFVGSSFLNCRKPQSKGIDQICRFLLDIPIPDFKAAHTHYSLAWVLSQIRSSIMAQAVQLQELSMWIQDNKDNLPQTMPHPEEVCQDLSAAGHALYLPNREDPPRSWLVLDLPRILHDVYGTLFSQSKAVVSEFGLLHCHCLAELFPEMDLKMVQQLFISLEFCLPVDPSILKVDLIKLTQRKEAGGWLFFPALIPIKHPQFITKDCPEQGEHSFCWQMRTSKKHSISARLLQTILLRLAAHFVVKYQCHDREGIQQHYCSIWWNGITWQSTDGVDVTVHIINNRVIQVVSKSSTSAGNTCQYTIDVISHILSTVDRLSPKLAAGAYIVHPPIVSTSPGDIVASLPQELFPVEGIQSSIRDHKMFTLSQKDSKNQWKRTTVTDLFGGYTPSQNDIERIMWTQPELNQTPSSTRPSHHEPNQTRSSTGSSQPRTVSSKFMLQIKCDQFYATFHYFFAVGMHFCI